MRKLMAIALMGLAAASCSDQLASMQQSCEGTWTLESRKLADGTVLNAPEIYGVIEWKPIDARKAHVTTTLIRRETEGQLFDHAASTYEISTSAITRKRHMLIQRGYRAREGAPFSHYPRGKTEKGKATLDGSTVKFFHAAKEVEEGKALAPDTGFHQTFSGDTMTLTYSGEFTDTYRRVN